MGLAEVHKQFPDANWYLIADSDTFIFPYRLVRMLRLAHRDPAEKVAIGFRYQVGSHCGSALPWVRLWSSDDVVVRQTHLANARQVVAGHHSEKLKFLLGGAGIVVSQGALQSLNLTMCEREQRENIAWNIVAADWRLGLCFAESKVEKEHQMYMYQSNAEARVLASRPGPTIKPGQLWASDLT
jgi:hypothetical protein